MAFGFLLTGRPTDADAALAALPAGFAPHPSLTTLREQVQSKLRGEAPPSPPGGERQGAP